MTDQHADFGPNEDSKTSPKATSNAELRVRLEDAEAGITSAIRQRKAAEDRARKAEAALDRVRQLAERWRYTADRKHSALPELRAALDQPAPGPDTVSPAVRHVHVTITNPDPYTANRAALSLTDWIRAEFPGTQVTTDAREWGKPTAGPDGTGTPEVQQLRTQLAEEQRLYRLRTEQWERVCTSRQRAEQQRDQYARLLRDILYASHNISSTDWARWREALDTITDKERHAHGL